MKRLALFIVLAALLALAVAGPAYANGPDDEACAHADSNGMTNGIVPNTGGCEPHP